MAFLIKIIPTVLPLVLLALFCPGRASAVTYSASPTDMPEYTLLSAPETGLPVRIKPGKPEIIHLKEDAGRVAIDDGPKNISAVIYDNRSIVLFPHSVNGGAHFTVFGRNGKPFMARYAVIGNPDKKYIRVHQACKTGHDPSCENDSVYFCPNLCYETQLIGAAAAQTATSK